MERKSYGDSVRTTVQKKIETRRKERQQERKDKRAEAKATAKENGNSQESSDDSSAENAEQKNKDDEASDDDSEDELAVEEARLQDALQERKQQSVTDADEVELKKAAAFFDDDPFQTEASEAQSFSDLKLCRPLIRAIASLGFSKPTPIQVLVARMNAFTRDNSYVNVFVSSNVQFLLH